MYKTLKQHYYTCGSRHKHSFWDSLFLPVGCCYFVTVYVWWCWIYDWRLCYGCCNGK